MHCVQILQILNDTHQIFYVHTVTRILLYWQKLYKIQVVKDIIRTYCIIGYKIIH